MSACSNYSRSTQKHKQAHTHTHADNHRTHNLPSFSFSLISSPLSLYASPSTAYISIYIAVCFTIERFIAIRYPLKRQTFCTESLAKKVIAGEWTSRGGDNAPTPQYPLLALDKHWGPFVLFWQPSRSSACWPRSRRRSSTHMTSIGNWLMAPTGPAIRPWQMCRPLLILRPVPHPSYRRKRPPHGWQMSRRRRRRRPVQPVQRCPAIWSTVIWAVAPAVAAAAAAASAVGMTAAAVMVSQVSKVA